MGPGAAIGRCLRQWGTFGGRARRSEFWWFAGFTWAVAIPVAIAFAVMWGLAFDGSLSGPADDPSINPDVVNTGWLSAGLLLLLAQFLVLGVPLLAVQARRLHDAGMPALWMLLHLVGLSIVPLVLCLVPGQRGSNRFGPDPTGAPSVAPATR
ncbi:DUF805 domain-containing protein [Demequina pelophila]|uniref:DUF805 domain-containing protein n=1 Tax=Demequina pelophila TaxID=1638984 RepID=UPI00078276AE|nr:DUF805 domain-containing protein [Demequina pelophila]